MILWKCYYNVNNILSICEYVYSLTIFILIQNIKYYNSIITLLYFFISFYFNIFKFSFYFILINFSAFVIFIRFFCFA